MNNSWRATLAANQTLLIDGGTGSELRRRGAPLHPDVWSGAAALTHQDLLCEIHHDYIAAGAQVITTNTFGTSRFVLEAAGFGGQFAAINRAAVEAACAARGASGSSDVAIAGSISCLPPRFDVRAYPDVATEKAAYRELAELLAELGVDFIALEMLQDSIHGRLACEAIAETGLPFWLGVSCRWNSAADVLVGFDFPDIPFTTTLDALLPYRPAAVCVMHSPTDAIAPAIDAIKARWDGWLGAYPEIDAELAPASFAAVALDWRQRGAHALGGCCGTTPAHIRALRDALASHNL